MTKEDKLYTQEEMQEMYGEFIDPELLHPDLWVRDQHDLVCAE